MNKQFKLIITELEKTAPNALLIGQALKNLSDKKINNPLTEEMKNLVAPLLINVSASARATVKATKDFLASPQQPELSIKPTR